MSNKTYNKLLLRATGPFQVLAVRSHAITIYKDGIDNTIIVDRGTRAPSATRVTQNQQARRLLRTIIYQDAKPIATQQSKRLASQTADQHLTAPRGKKLSKPAENHQPEGCDPEYTVDRFVCHVDLGTDTRNEVRRYVYGVDENTENHLGACPKIL